MWWRRSALVLVVALAAATIAPALSRTTSITQVGQRPVVIATLPCQSSVQVSASGLVISDGLVVTVAHAIYDSRDFAVRDATGIWHRPTLRYIDLERDLALLEISELSATPIVIRVAQPGDRVRMLAGATSGTVDGDIMRRVRITTGVIGDPTQISVRSGYELSVDITGGDSGAAVVDDDDRLVAVVFARSTSRDASWATSVTEIEDILDRRGGPTWQCARESDVELFLPPLPAD